MNTHARMLGAATCSFAASSPVPTKLAVIPRIRSLVFAVAALLAFVSTSPRALCASGGQLTATAYQKDIQERFRVAGIVRMAGRSFASLVDHGSGKSDWVETGDYFMGYDIKEIRKDSLVIKRRGGANEVELFLTGSPDSNLKPVLEPYSKEWINSYANPMYYAPFPPPLDIAREWSALSNEQIAEIIQVYRSFGWNLITSNTVAGSTQFAWENIYEADRKAAHEKARVDFEKSLNENQKAIYAKIRANPAPLKIGKEGLTPEQKIGDDIRRTEWDKLKASMSPSQREIYEAIRDSQKAMQRK